MEPYRKNRNPSGPRLATRESYWVTWTQADLEKDGGRRGCRKQGLGFRVVALGCRCCVWGFGCWVWGFECWEQGLGFRVCWVQGSGLWEILSKRVLGLGLGFGIQGEYIVA